MPYRTVPLITNQYYHVYNRGVAKLPVFMCKRDYDRFLLTLSYYRFVNIQKRLSKFLTLSHEERQNIMDNLKGTSPRTVTIIAYVLLPNHFHLLIQQSNDNGINIFLTRVLNSYSKYVNTRSKRVGPLWQGPFKAVRIEDDEQLFHVSRYIHLNPLLSYVCTEQSFLQYPWSSLPEYLLKPILVDPSVILSHFSSKQTYKSFVLDQIEYGKKLEKIKHLILENP